jgi:hypothetical protein
MIMYKLIKNPITGQAVAVKKELDSQTVMSIPFDPANTDYIAYLAWLAEGNQPEAAE